MTDAELLQHYIQSTRVIPGAQRSPGHHRLLKLGFIAEHPVSIKNLLITLTAAGRTAIDCRPAAYVGHTPRCGVSSPLSPQKRPRTMGASRDPARLRSKRRERFPRHCPARHLRPMTSLGLSRSETLA